MTVQLSSEESAFLAGGSGAAVQLAMRIVVRMGEILGAGELVEITSSHIDGCLYHGDGGVEFAERLVELGGTVTVPATLNVGALDLLNPARVRSHGHRREMALRQMRAYQALGCAPTWTCAPYQAGHRPAMGEHVAWGESNAVCFANSVLGARTNRYGDFMDICCAIAGRAPRTGLHLGERRRATVVIDTSRIDAELRRRDVFYPVLGTWLGATVDDRVAVVTGLPGTVTEDQLKAMGAAAASSGAVGLFHVEGVTPEAPDLPTALGGLDPDTVIAPTPDALRATRDTLSTAGTGRIDAVAVGSPHFSLAEFARLEALLPAAPFASPLLRLHRALRVPPPGGRRPPAPLRRRRRPDRGRHLRRGHPDPSTEGRGADDQLRQVRALHSVQHRVRGGLRQPRGLRPVGLAGPGRAAGSAVELKGVVVHAGPGEPTGPDRRRAHDDGPSPTGARAPAGHRPPTEGRLLVLRQPISFWGGVDPLTGAIMDPRHPRHGTRLGGRVLVMERTIGSSSSSAVMLELLRNRVAPAAIVVGRPDAILVLGILVAQELGYSTIPVVRLDRRDIARLAEADGARATIAGGTLRIERQPGANGAGRD